MSCFLITSSFVTTLLIPAAGVRARRPANGRALAYLAHEYLGNGFGTVYDVCTIVILWFAGASAMAGLLNLVPRYLPRYGMAPEWARAVRPLVLVFTAIAFLVTWVFDANVDAQGGAYATGVLVLMTSASVRRHAVRRAAEPARQALGFAVIAAVFVYTTIANVIERPDGVRIASLFIVAISRCPCTSRIRRAFELRAGSIVLDETAAGFFAAYRGRDVQLVAHDPDRAGERTLGFKERATADREPHPRRGPVIFLEVTLTDASEFARLQVARDPQRPTGSGNVQPGRGQLDRRPAAAPARPLRDQAERLLRAGPRATRWPT